MKKITILIILTVGITIPIVAYGEEKLQKISGILDKTKKNKNLLKINKDFAIEARGEKVKEIPDDSLIVVIGPVHLDIEELKDDDKSNDGEPPLINFTPYIIVEKYKILDDALKTKWKKRKARHVSSHRISLDSSKRGAKSILISNEDYNILIGFGFFENNREIFSSWAKRQKSEAQSIPKHAVGELKYYLTPEKKKPTVSIRVKDDFSFKLDNYKIIYSDIKEQRNEIEVNTDLLKLWKILAARDWAYRIDGITVPHFSQKKELTKAEQTFVDKYVSAYIKNDKDAMMKLIHPKCIALYRSKNASEKLLNMIMNSKGYSSSKLSLKWVTITPEKNKSEEQYPKKYFNKLINETVIYPVRATHCMGITFYFGPTSGRPLVFENGEFYLSVPYVEGDKKDKKSNNSASGNSEVAAPEL